MRYVMVLFCLLAAPQTLRAETSFIQSGEHDGFTRLVAEVENEQSWNVIREGDRVIMQLQRHDDGFNISRVYDFIGRERVAELQATSDTLSITLGCDCQVSTFPVGDTHVVIDIGSPDVDLPMPVMAEQTYPNLLLPALSVDSQDNPPSPGNATIVDHNETSGGLERADLDNVQRGVLDSAREELLRELAAAASNGLLQPDAAAGQRNDNDAQIDLSTLDDALEAVETPDLPQDPLGRLAANMSVTTSLDVPPSKRRLLDTFPLQSARCPPEGALSVSDWGNDTPFHQQLSAARQGLYGEFDRLDRDTAIGLARTYLFFGFGAEAAQVLELLPDRQEDHALLHAISKIFEFGELPGSNPFGDISVCDPTAAMWSILAGDLPKDRISAALDNALLELNGLPTHLRQVLAPLLSRRLGEAGFDDGAAAALRSLERLQTNLSPSGQLAEAKVLLQQGEERQATTKLEELIAKNDKHAPEAIITLANYQLETGQPISFEMAELVEAYTQELSGGPLGLAMRQAHVAALIQSNQFDRAFQAVTSLNGKAGDAAGIRLRRHLLTALIDRADDVMFLQYALVQSETDIANLALRDKIRMAERMLTLGFSLPAQRVLDTIPDRPRNDARQHLAARIALDLGQPFRAQAELIGIVGPEAVALLADAKLMAGQNNEAHDLYQQAGDTQEALRAAWLSEDWRNLTPADVPVFGPAATLPSIADGDPAALEGMLERSADALKKSAEARQALQELLIATQPENEPGN